MTLDSSRQVSLDGLIQLQDAINFAVLLTCHVLIKRHYQQQQHNFCHHRLMKCMDRYFSPALQWRNKMAAIYWPEGQVQVRVKN